MGSGYWILLHDGWGAGLVMINPRFHSEGVDMYGNPLNWWPLHDESETDGSILARHGLADVEFARVVRQ